MLATVSDVSFDEDGATTISVSGSDVDGDALTFSITGGSEITAILVADANNEIIFTASENFNGSETFTVTVTDEELSDSQDITVTVNAVNDAPVATTGLSTITAEDQSIVIILNGIDIDGDALIFSLAADATNGSVVINGVVATYTPSQDFNGDDNIDIALATSSSASSSIRLYMGKGNGAFFKPRTLAKGLVPLALIKKDMNDNGLQDLIFSSGQGDNMYILFSRGDGTFRKEITFSGGGGPVALTAGHFNPDNQVDIAVANSRSSNFSLVMRTTNESFHYPTRDYVVDGGTPLAITSGDYNNDGMTDIAVASSAKNTIEVYLQRKIFH